MATTISSNEMPLPVRSHLFFSSFQSKITNKGILMCAQCQYIIFHKGDSVYHKLLPSEHGVLPRSPAVSFHGVAAIAAQK